ncbi:MAG: DUF3987 domain-containing protein [Acidobacteriota bacterium]|nr:DUF3987 domain-containing protein [Acidobacteriota bacterium]
MNCKQKASGAVTLDALNKSLINNMNLSDYLKAFLPDENEKIHFRAFKAKDAPDTNFNRAAKISFSRKELMNKLNETELRKLNHHRGIYFVVNSGGDNDKQINHFNAVFVENDEKTLAEQNRALDKCPIPTSIRIETKKSIHAYWLLNENCSADIWSDLQLRLIGYFDGDPVVKNPSRVMRLPFFQHLTYNSDVRGNYEHKLVEVKQFNPERRYSIEQLQIAFPAVKLVNKKSEAQFNGQETINNGERNSTLFSLAGTLRRKGLDEMEIAAALKEVNRNRVNPPLAESELSLIAKNITRYEPEEDFTKPAKLNIETEKSISVPVLSEKAFYGLAGEIVRTIEPHTEADNAALLVQLLTGFGSLVNKAAYFRAEADFHYTKLFAVLVGASSKGRKGTSWGQIRRLLLKVDETFINVIQDGLSSGEGLIYHVRDPQSKSVPIKEKGKITGYQDEIVDEGAKEKRAFIIEPEFARVLRAMQRDGNTLSSIIRQAWDSDRLKIMTKNPIHASDAHISIVGHITKDELLRNLDETETANGFANRFLWIYTRRSKYLPEGGNLCDSEINHLVEKLKLAVVYAKITKELKRDDQARKKWIEIYPKLSDGHTGLLGAVTSRGEAQVMRLACLYALLDKSEEIKLPHLEAALALWQYSEDSAKYIFGNQTGNKIADEIYNALLASEVGLTRTDLSNLFKRNKNSNQIDRALKVLIDLGRITVEKEQTEGRPREILKVMRYEKNEFNEERQDYEP